jgi:hypothetical protein
VQKYHSGKEVLHLWLINPRSVTNGVERSGMAAKAVVVCDLAARRGRLSSPVLRFLGVELRIVRFRVRAVLAIIRKRSFLNTAEAEGYS